MTTTAEVASDLFVEFRCTKCYQQRHEPAEHMGTEVSCPFCGQQQTAPVVNDDELMETDRVLAAMSKISVQQGQFNDKPLTREEMDEIAKARAEERNAEANEFRGVTLHAPPTIRLCAAIIDSFITIGVLVLSFGLGQLTVQLGLCPAPEANNSVDLQLIFLICHLGLFICYQPFIWTLIATRGQTPGKMLMGIKIVNGFGNPPGFISGVFLRIILAGVICAVIPLGPMLNALWILNGTPPRCGHDHLAGTDVVHA